MFAWVYPSDFSPYLFIIWSYFSGTKVPKLEVAGTLQDTKAAVFHLNFRICREKRGTQYIQSAIQPNLLQQIQVY